MESQGQEGGRGLRNISGSVDWPLYIYLGLVAGVLVYISLFEHHVGNLMTETDFYWAHLPQAMDVLTGRFPDYGNKMPLYSALLALAYSLVGDWFRSGQIISIVFGVANVWLLAKIARHLAGGSRLAGWIVAVLVSANYWHFRMSYEVSRDTLLYFMSTASLYALIVHGGRRGALWWSGAFGALAVLTRLNGLVLAPTILVCVFVAERFDWRRTLRRAALPALVVVLTLPAWMGVKWACIGSAEIVTPTALTSAVHSDHRRAVNLSEMESTDIARSMARSVAKRVGIRVLRDVRDVVGLPLAVILGFSLALAAARRRWTVPAPDTAALLTFVVSSFFMLCLFHYEHRYSLTYVYIIPILGIVALLDAVRGRWWPWRAAAVACVAVAIGWGAVHTARTTRFMLSLDPEYLIPFGNYLRSEVNDPNAVVVAYKPHIRFYGNVTWRRVGRRVQSLDDLIARSRGFDADFILFCWAEGRIYSRCGDLRTPRTDIDGLVPVFWTDAGTLYKLEPARADGVLGLPAPADEVEPVRENGGDEQEQQPSARARRESQPRQPPEHDDP